MLYRPDTPQVGSEGERQKYLYPAEQSMRLDVHPRCAPLLQDPAIPLWVTEGVKKADALVSHALCAVTLLGVDGWRGTNDKGGKMALPEWYDIAMRGRDIRLVFDSDIMEKPQWSARCSPSPATSPPKARMSMPRICPARMARKWASMTTSSPIP